ncbi:MAG: hypothetical protein RIC55_24870 [Pirellulaceae bacterium]
MDQPTTDAKTFPCPQCNSLRESHTADCPFCGWRHRTQTPQDVREIQQRACPCCGGEDYWWDKVRTRHPLRTLEEGASWWEMAGLNLPTLRVRKCRRCGNVQFFADVTRDR